MYTRGRRKSVVGIFVASSRIHRQKKKIDRNTNVMSRGGAESGKTDVLDQVRIKMVVKRIDSSSSFLTKVLKE